MKKAFTLIEMLIVLLLVSIVYGIYFFTISSSAKEKKFSLIKVKEFLINEAKEHGDKLSIICNGENKICYLLNSKQEIIKDFKFKENVKTFLLKQDEVLESVEYNNIELNEDIYFRPTLIFKKLTHEQFETLIYYTDDGKWVYISPYFDDAKEFINKEDIISYIKKRDYLPMYAGLAE
ncbi:prepilin-type N-terminal cleavage/methylation domain-containing protein [Sulfurimonas sp.]|uniref:prepilin-type N-terminal cleavage/methylation domain-containing protein n=1 Tax=Sulfurimonas sp. TaxID=2022749 RepID=UPI003563F5FE